MSLQEIKNLKNEKGFTIVELLIVIVVIGILAAIVIVAFNGVQSQAKAAQFKTDAAAIAKLAEAYNADDTTAVAGYPTSKAAIEGYTNVKLPATVRLDATPIATATADPTTQAASVVGESGGVKTYKWKSCSATNGLEVYYWDPSASVVRTATAGNGC